MRLLQIAAVVLAIALAAGETVRSWGVGRPLIHVIDDWVGAAILLMLAWLTGRPGHRSRRIVTGFWGVIAGATISSFVAKLTAPAAMTPGNLSPALLTTLVGLAALVSLACLVASILLPVTESSR